MWATYLHAHGSLLRRTPSDLVPRQLPRLVSTKKLTTCAGVMCLTLLNVVGCSHAARAGSTSSSKFTGEVHVGKGIACSYLGDTGPPSYPVKAIGRPGVPAVSPADVRMLRFMKRYVHPSTLRFAMLNIGFSVFDATNGPCSATPYSILNAPSCNVIYVPFDATGNIGAATGCNMQPRPWIARDVGNPRGLSWKDYPNSH